MVNRHRVSTPSSYEQEFAFSRVVAQGDWVFVAGTTGFDYETMTLQDGVVAQAEQCFANISAALSEASASLDDVVRVTYYLADRNHFAVCGPVIQRYFATSRPVATAIQVELVDPRLEIEIEVTALRQKA